MSEVKQLAGDVDMETHSLNSASMDFLLHQLSEISNPAVTHSLLKLKTFSEEEPQRMNL